MNEDDLGEAKADRMPTTDEERLADQAAADVDLAEVGKNEQHMNELGAHAKGEGQIEPDAREVDPEAGQVEPEAD